MTKNRIPPELLSQPEKKPPLRLLMTRDQEKIAERIEEIIASTAELADKIMQPDLKLKGNLVGFRAADVITPIRQLRHYAAILERNFLEAAAHAGVDRTVDVTAVYLCEHCDGLHADWVFGVGSSRQQPLRDWAASLVGWAIEDFGENVAVFIDGQLLNEDCFLSAEERRAVEEEIQDDLRRGGRAELETLNPGERA